MTPERWRRIESLFQEALARPVGERSAFLNHACADDESLRRDVDSLIAEATGDADDFLAVPAASFPAQMAASLPPASMAGVSLGGYHLKTLIGVGGMGEVYQAHHAALGRDVAIKILSRTFVSDPARLARFESEARMLAALNHPNICAIYGFEQADSVRFLILELVDGETLAEKLARVPTAAAASGLPIPEVLQIARQITEALEAAHEKGIVHRDLKPANIKMSSTGTVKVLDFGLAKATTNGSQAQGNHSVDGVVLGTAAYMSPEQARGQAVDKRTDIWSFGCVLYEMLSGRMAFAGETISDSIAKILEREPDWSALPRTTPIIIQRLLHRCLEKNPKQRLRDIGDVRIEIDAMEDGMSNDAERIEPRPVQSRSRWLPWAGATALTAALAGVLAWNARAIPMSTITRFTLTLPQGQVLNGSRGAHIVALSPDGSQIAYSGTPYGLFIRSMADTVAKAIPGTEAYEVAEPAFSPDGRSIAFFAIGDSTLMKVAVTGGAPQALCPARPPTGIRWGPEGIVFGQGPDGIKRISADGGNPDLLVVVQPGELAHGPQILPGGGQLIFTLATGTAPSRWDRAKIFVQSLKSGDRKLLIDGGSDARYLPTGHVVYAIRGSLYAVAFDPGKLELQGDPTPVIDGVRRAAGNFTGAAAFSTSTNGSLVYVPGPIAGEASAPLDLGLMSRNGEVEPLNLPPGPYSLPRISPDGRKVAFGSDDGKEEVIYTYELSGAAAMQRLTPGKGNRFPVWASNEKLAFQSDREGDRAIWWQALSGSAERLTRPERGTAHAPESWFDDTLLYSVTKGADVSLWTYSLRDRVTSRFDAVPSTAPTGAVFSPDGRWVAYSSTQGSQMTLYLQGFPTGARYPLTAKVTDTPKHPRWTRDGKELCYDPNVYDVGCVSISHDPFAFGNVVNLPKKLGFSPPGTRTNYDVAPDGRLLGTIAAGKGEYVRGSSDQIQVVLNWFEDLKTRAPRRN